jgi:ABC-type transport system substrate-binding protein
MKRLIVDSLIFLSILQQGQLVPRLATHWQWRDHRTRGIDLRRGVTFHNGERFDADIVKLNWEEYLRLQPLRLAGQFLNFKLSTSTVSFLKLSAFGDRQ